MVTSHHLVDVSHLETVFRLIYASRVVGEMSEDDLVDIANEAKVNNAMTGVTGLLIRCGDEFLQFLEGDEETVRRLFRTIERDPRHEDATIIAEETVHERVFGDWSMGCFLFPPEALKEGFFFTEENGRHRLNVDALHLADDAVRCFYVENREAGMAATVTSLDAA